MQDGFIIAAVQSSDEHVNVYRSGVGARDKRAAGTYESTGASFGSSNL